MSVLLVNPMVAPQVQQTARALLEAGQLQKFITTVRHDKSALWQRVANSLAKAVDYDLESQFKRRTLVDIPGEWVESLPWGELLRLAVAKLDKSGRAGDRVWQFTEQAFGKAASRRVCPPVTAVYSYEYCAREVFDAAKSRGVRMIYETPAAEPRFAYETVQREIRRFPEVTTSYNRHEAKHQEERIAWRRSEWLDADLVVANSTFTRSTFAAAGLDVGKVRVVPLGAPPPIDREGAAGGGSGENSPLRFIWAGKFGILKGGHYLLDAWRAGNLHPHARLDVFGIQALPSSMVNPPPPGIHFHGMVSRAQLHEEFRKADALVFPTLGDGFGMVATEAWAQGLPVIMTPNAGAADLLRPGENGILTAPGDAAALAETLLWCVSHRGALRAMRPGARATAAAWQWQDYRKALLDALRPVLGPDACP